MRGQDVNQIMEPRLRRRLKIAAMSYHLTKRGWHPAVPVGNRAAQFGAALCEDCHSCHVVGWWIRIEDESMLATTLHDCKTCLLQDPR